MDHLEELAYFTLAPLLRTVFGEQLCAWTDSCGRPRFLATVAGAEVSFSVVGREDGEPIVESHHIVGARVIDDSAAIAFCNDMNSSIAFGRYALVGDNVVFTHTLSRAATNENSLRDLIVIVAGASANFPDLASRAGAIPLADARDLQEL